MSLTFRPFSDPNLMESLRTESNSSKSEWDARDGIACRKLDFTPTAEEQEQPSLIEEAFDPKTLTPDEQITLAKKLADQDAQFGTNMMLECVHMNQTELDFLRSSGLSLREAIEFIFNDKFPPTTSASKIASGKPTISSRTLSGQTDSHSHSHSLRVILPVRIPSSPSLTSSPSQYESRASTPVSRISSLHSSPSNNSSSYYSTRSNVTASEDIFDFLPHIPSPPESNKRPGTLMRRISDPAMMGTAPKAVAVSMTPLSRLQTLQRSILSALSEDEQLSLSLLLSEQEAKFGVHMLEALLPSDLPEIDLWMAHNYRFVDIARFLFEKKFEGKTAANHPVRRK